MPSGARRAIAGTAVALLLLLVVGRIAAEFLVDLFWYRSLGLADVFWTRWNAALIVRLVAGLIAAVVVFLNLRVVARTIGNVRLRRRYGNLEIAERLPSAYVFGALLAVSLLSAWWLSGATGDPVAVLAALRAVPWGIEDPVFGRDLSFYVFRLPLLTRAQAFAAVILFWSLLLSGIAYIASGGVRWADSEFSISPAARRHLGLLIAGLFAVLAWDLWLDRYDLLMAGHGVGGALGYTDVAARIPARSIVAVLTLAAAASVAYGAWRGSAREPLAGIGLLVIGAITAQIAFPSLVQKFRVEPDELAREAPYIASNIAFTRLAYGLASLERRPLPYIEGSSLEPEQVSQALAGAPLWDPRPLLQSYQALETRRRYYNFVSAHYDRYAGEQVVISVRELEPQRLAEVAQTWQNLHLNYVRGEGAVVSPATRLTAGGEPPYLLSEMCPPRLAPNAPPSLRLDDPGVYFSERTRGYVVVTPGRVESTLSECPSRGEPIGVPLRSRWAKLLYAWAFQSKNLLLSEELLPGSRIVYRRGVRDRAAEIAPFLLFPAAAESAPLPVISDGRIVWILDAYTASGRFPLAPAAGIGEYALRYIRNSVKVTVDGVTGAVRFYAVDERDPLLQTYRAIFPDLFRPLAEMPGELQRHLRFPAPLLAMQAQVLREYHLDSPPAFYSREDVWDVPTELYRDQPEQVHPIFATFPLPGSEQPEFLLSIPFVAAGRPTLSALLVARNDPPHYGEQILFEVPREQGVPGPQQIESLIDQDAEISQQLSLWKRGGSDVVRGRLLAIPVDSTLVYLEPLYLEAQASAIPQLERIILVRGNRVVMRPSLEAAIAALTGREAPEAVQDTARSTDPELAATPPRTDGPLARARELVERAEAQLRAGDWAGFGRTWSALRELLRANPSP